MQTRTIKVQTAFRFDPALLERMKRKARKEGKSLNAFVEETLSRAAPAELEWPKVKGPVVIPQEIKDLMLPRALTSEELAEDDRAAYILR